MSSAGSRRVTARSATGSAGSSGARGSRPGRWARFLSEVTTRPLYAYVAAHNVASVRVLAKCGFTISNEKPASSEEPHGDGDDEVVLKLEEGRSS